MKSILFIGDYPNPVEPVRNVFFQKLIWQIADMGVNCTVLAPIPFRGKKSLEIPDRVDEKTMKGNTVHILFPKYVSFSAYKIGKFNTATLSELSFRRIVKKCTRKLNMNFDAVYGHFILHGGLSAVDISEKYGIPAFFACGESDINIDTFAKYPYRWVRRVSKCRGVISVSTKNKKDLVDARLFEESDIIVEPNAVDDSIFHTGSKSKARESLGFNDKDFIAAFAGYFIERKGDKRVLEAAKDLTGIKLAFAGKGDNPPKGNNVLMAEPLTHEKMPLFYQAADVFVLPTLAEGCCNSIVEAMSCGLPIISSDRAFNDDILDETNSLRVDPMSVKEIHDALEKLYSDDVLRKKLSTGAIEKTRAMTIERRAERILRFMGSRISA